MLLKRFLEDLIGLLLPDLCCGCGTHLYLNESQLCTICLYRLPYTDHHLHAENRAARQLWGRLPCNAVMSLLYFNKGSRVQNIIHHLKYKGRKDLGIKLGKMIAEKLQINTSFLNIDLIIPVPLHRSRLHTRSYNQSMCIAEGIASILKVPIDSNSLLRTKRSATQTKKRRYNRFENMQEMFSIVNDADIKGKHILLVDDVMTTGATLEACGHTLLSAGIGKLSIATIAFTK
ncbi:phosphoribosyltransferase family protein [Pedobacter sp. ASV1-7]|uniref:ComF family protein n=1 Tax=Pedobacter sp. ASV1-7 TaxID=3145237 RepID=UPI0032E8F817